MPPPPQSATFWAAAGLIASLLVGYAQHYFFATPAGDGIVIDGRAFPPTVTVGGITQQLTGGGTRVKYGVAKVYAVALYLDRNGAASSLKRFAGGAAPTKQSKFYDALINGGFARTLHIKMHRPVAADAMVSALNEALSKRLSTTVVDKFRAAFLGALPSDSLARGDALSLMCKGNALHIAAGGTKQTVREKGLCSALFDVYFGKSPVSPAAKEGVATGFASRKLYDA